MLAYQSFQIKRRSTPLDSQKVMADFHSHCEINLINMLCVILLNNHFARNNGAEIKKYQAGPDFLGSVLHLFRMEISDSNGMHKIPKRSFDSPAHMVQLLDFFERELVSGEICDNIYKIIICDLGANNPKEK